MAIRVGLSGWSYRDWAGSFYPDDLQRGEWLRFVAGIFSTVEVNRTFYSLLRPDTYRRWREQVPTDFMFSLKGSRYITHLKRLRDVDKPMANFFASGVLELGPQLETILWQLPARSNVTSDALVSFLSKLPTSTHDAAAMAKEHDQRVPDFEPSSLIPSPIRHALELRHPDSLDEEVRDAARAHNVAIAMSHASTWPLFDETTADFAYIRLHGPGELYHSGYPPEQLDEWASRIEQIDTQRDVLVYFDNDGNAHAPRDAMALIERLARG
jgi:uncharacterized protein YecE (DUF72 family)